MITALRQLVRGNLLYSYTQIVKRATNTVEVYTVSGEDHEWTNIPSLTTVPLNKQTVLEVCRCNQTFEQTLDLHHIATTIRDSSINTDNWSTLNNQHRQLNSSSKEVTMKHIPASWCSNVIQTGWQQEETRVFGTSWTVRTEKHKYSLIRPQNINAK